MKNFRISRRKTIYTDPPIKTIATRVSTRASFNSNTTTSADFITPEHFSNVFVDSPIGLEEEENDEEWNVTFTPNKKRSKTKTGKKIIAVNKLSQSISKRP